MPLNHQRISIVYAVITLSVFVNLKDKNDITYKKNDKFHTKEILKVCLSTERQLKVENHNKRIFAADVTNEGLSLLCVSSSPAFLMMYSAYKLNKQGDNIQP